MSKITTSERLKEIMAKRNLKQVDILRACEPYCQKYNIKLGRNDLSQYISGKVQPGQDKLTILAKALNVNEVWLMGYEVPQIPEEQLINEYGLLESELITLFNKLNEVGKKEALKRIKELTLLPIYTSSKET